MVILSGLAFKGGPKGRPELLLYLALCDHSDERGYSFPGLARLAWWTRQNEKNVRRILPKLKEWVKVTPAGRGQTYQIDIPRLCRSALASGIKLNEAEQKFVQATLDKLPTVDKMSAITEASTVDISDTRLRTFPTSTVDISDPPIENRQETSLISTPPLRVVRESASAKKPQRKAAEPNPTHTPVQRALEAMLQRSGVVARWGSGPSGALGLLLKGLPDQPLQFWETCIANLEQSAPKYRAKALAVMISALPEFQQGPKDAFGNITVSQGAQKARTAQPSQMEIERAKAIAATSQGRRIA